MMKKFLCILAALLLCVSVCAAEEIAAEDITLQTTIYSPGRITDALCDGKYTSYWNSREQRNPTLEFTTPEGVEAEYLYICFGEMPKAWAIEEEVNGEWITLVEGTQDYYHVCLTLGGKSHFRLIDTTGYNVKFKINEVSVFTAGELPDWVQRWEPTVEKADMLLLVAHPDDELIFFGGTIPTYDVERDLDVVVAYMTYSNTTRRSELLNGLWLMGVRNYPVICEEFYDGYSSSLKVGYQKWPKNEVDAYITELIRKYKPEVMLTHDIEGEYGHGAHRVCADAAQYCVANAANPEFQPASAEVYGTWEVKKLYLHLYKENALTMDWNVPLASLGGKTGLELAQEAYLLHVTQQTTDFVVTDEGKTSCAEFGLVHSTVGEDLAKNDFMENIPSYDLSNYGVVGFDPNAPGSTLPPTPTPSPTPMPTPTPTPTPEPIKVQAEVEWPEADRQKDEKGYLPAGEYVYENEEDGVWFYASPTLVVRIDRFFDAEAVNTWYEAQIYCDLSQERVGAILHNPEKPQAKHVQASQIAREKQVVFGVNTDYYTYRLGRKTITGMVIRGGQVFYNRVPAANRSQFPNLDTLAMYEDGSWAVFQSDELTAEEYLADGAIDVFSFGPYLVRDGEINPFIAEMKNGKTGQPRCAIGMIEPGHYYAVLAEGRIRNKATGVSVEWMANHMLEKGCTMALNLDGGQTAVMTFMGNQITRIGKYNGGKTSARTTTEIIGVGHSDQIDPEAK